MNPLQELLQKQREELKKRLALSHPYVPVGLQKMLFSDYEKDQQELIQQIVDMVEGMEKTKEADLESEKEIVKRDNWFYNKALTDLKAKLLEALQDK